MNARWLICVPIAAAAASTGCRREAAPNRPGAPPPVVVTRTGVQMARLPGGWFEMGSRAGLDEEKPAHRVWVDAFLIDTHEVTQGQFRRLEIPDPSHFKDPNRPVEQVTFADAIEYCNERSAAEGLRACYTLDRVHGTWVCKFDANGYRLPTEAEWEYACRAGTTSERHFAPDTARALARHAWCADNSSKRTHPVGQRRPNAWGLHDMYGNVAEWCGDWYDANTYGSAPRRNPRGPATGKLVVRRGGAWDSKANHCRSAARTGEDPRFHDICFARDTIGFRCVRKAPE